jgi:hypothetical protein
MLQRLIGLYAMRSREFADAVALMGKHQQITQEFLELLGEIKRLRELSDEAAAELDRHISRTGESAVSRSSDSLANEMVGPSERNALIKNLDKARTRYLESSRAFLKVTEDVPSGIPYPDSTERLERLARAQQQTFEQYQQARKKVDEHIAGMANRIEPDKARSADKAKDPQP